MGIAVEQTGEENLLRLNGSVDISVADELKMALLEALAAAKPIRISADGVVELDVAAFQLLWAAARQAKKAGVRFMVTGEIAEAVREELSATDLDARALSS
jgi:anti-anti-sigma factor